MNAHATFETIMAGEAIRQLEEQLKCAICLDIYADPKLLQCFHVYCSNCLVKLVRDQQGELSLTCPTCRQVTPIAADGVAGLQPAFQTNGILRIRDNFMRKTGANADVTSLELASEVTISKCREHSEEGELYCDTCGEVICLKCAIKGGKHQSHDYSELKNAYEQYKGEVTPFMKPMEENLNTVEKALAQFDLHCKEISTHETAIITSIDSTVRQLHEFLDVRKTELISQVHQITQGKTKALSTQRDEIETIQAQLSSCFDFVKKSLKTKSQGEVLAMKTNILKQVMELIVHFQPEVLEPITEVDVTFKFSPDVDAVCRNYGKVYATGEPDLSQCQVTGKGLELAMVGEMSTAILQVLNTGSEQCSRLLSLECELVSEITGTRVRGTVQRRGKNQYEIGYQPTVKGRHCLHIKLEGQHIRGSPFSVVVKKPVEKLDNPILTIDRMKRPWGVALNQKGELVVTERNGNCVSVFSQRGKKLRSFGFYGSCHGQFNGPRGVAIDSEENILVADYFNHRIQKFTTTGKFLTAVSSEGSGHLQFDRPFDIAFNASNSKIYVVDWNHRVQVLNSDLTFSSIFGKKGIGKGQFNISSCGIACDGNGMVYIVDNENHRIQVFTADGKFVRMFGKHGQGRGELNRPTCIAIDANYLVYVSELHNKRVSVYNSEGQFVTSFGRDEKGELFGLAVDNSGVVYVCDRNNNCIRCF